MIILCCSLHAWTSEKLAHYAVASLRSPISRVGGSARQRMSELGQKRKIRARLLQVRFTPLSGRMLRRVSMTACGHQQNAVLKAKGIRDATAPQHARLQAGLRDSLRTMQVRL